MSGAYLPDILGTIETTFTLGDPNPTSPYYNANTITLSNENGVLAIRDANNVNLVGLEVNLVAGAITGVTIDNSVIGGTTPALGTFGIADAGTNTVVYPLTIRHNTSGSPTLNFGAGVQFELDDSTTPSQVAGAIAAVWTTATHASRVSEIILYTENSTGLVASLELTPTIVSVPSGLSLGVGLFAPLTVVHVVGASTAYNSTPIFTLSTGTGIASDEQFYIGIDNGNYVYIQAIKPGTAFRPILINPSGGSVGIGVTGAPAALLEVNGNVQLDANLAHTGTNAGFFNHAVAGQPSATGAAAGYAAGTTGATFHSDDTYTGNSGTTKYTVNGIVAALKSLGLLAA